MVYTFDHWTWVIDRGLWTLGAILRNNTVNFRYFTFFSDFRIVTIILQIKAISVFCGANFNGDPILKLAVEQLAEVMVSRNITLIYGGGKVGVMGILADAILNNNGKAIGVIPQFLIDKEVGHTGLTELHVVENMH